MTIDAAMLSYLAGTATYTFNVYRELDAAGRAYLERRDPAPLLRIAAEQWYWGDAGDPAEFSEGLYIAVICNDYPQHWDITSPIASREAQYQREVAKLRARQPRAFAPFTIDDWLASPWTEFRSCLQWPAPSRNVAPVPKRADYPDVPTLVLAGDLDSITSSEGARVVADRFPNSTFVQIRNGVHVMALADQSRCASDIVVRFVRTRDAGSTRCRTRYNEVRMVDEFPRYWRGVDARTSDQRFAATALHAVADVFPRWQSMTGETGFGLRGGRFTTAGDPDVTFELDGVKWVRDVAVDGHVTWDRSTGAIAARVAFVSPHGTRASLRLAWNDWDRHATATVTGRVGGHRVDLRLPAA
jgi:hypothetical protein